MESHISTSQEQHVNYGLQSTVSMPNRAAAVCKSRRQLSHDSSPACKDTLPEWDADQARQAELEQPVEFKGASVLPTMAMKSTLLSRPSQEFFHPSIKPKSSTSRTPSAISSRSADSGYGSLHSFSRNSALSQAGHEAFEIESNSADSGYGSLHFAPRLSALSKAGREPFELEPGRSLPRRPTLPQAGYDELEARPASLLLDLPAANTVPGFTTPSTSACDESSTWRTLSFGDCLTWENQSLVSGLDPFGPHNPQAGCSIHLDDFERTPNGLQSNASPPPQFGFFHTDQTSYPTLGPDQHEWTFGSQRLLPRLSIASLLNGNDLPSGSRPRASRQPNISHWSADSGRNLSASPLPKDYSWASNSQIHLHNHQIAQGAPVSKTYHPHSAGPPSIDSEVWPMFYSHDWSPPSPKTVLLPSQDALLAARPQGQKYSCPVCPYRTIREEALPIHLERLHPEYNPSGRPPISKPGKEAIEAIHNFNASTKRKPRLTFNFSRKFGREAPEPVLARTVEQSREDTILQIAPSLQTREHGLARRWVGQASGQATSRQEVTAISKARNGQLDKIQEHHKRKLSNDGDKLRAIPIQSKKEEDPVMDTTQNKAPGVRIIEGNRHAKVIRSRHRVIDRSKSSCAAPLESRDNTPVLEFSVTPPGRKVIVSFDAHPSPSQQVAKREKPGVESSGDGARFEASDLSAGPTLKKRATRASITHQASCDPEPVATWLADVEAESSGVKAGASADLTSTALSGDTPVDTSMSMLTPVDSNSMTPDVPWFASDGEASFVLGDELQPSNLLPDTPRFIHETKEVADQLVTAYFSAADVHDFVIPFRSKETLTSRRLQQNTGNQHQNQLTKVSSPTDDPGNRSESSSNTGSPPRSGSATTQSPRPGGRLAATSHPRKRVCSDGEENDGTQRRKISQGSTDSSNTKDGKLLACPYSKFDPLRYSERNTGEKNYRGCSSCYLRDIARLKQHLYRVHRRPEHHCPCCFASFTSRVLLDNHIRERICESVDSPFEEKMTPDQLTLIKRRDIGRSASDAWYDIFKVLFVGTPLPLSPYVENAHVFTINDFRAFFDSDAQGVLSREVNRRMLGDTSLLEPQFLDGVWREAVSTLLQYLEHREQQSSAASDE